MVHVSDKDDIKDFADLMDKLSMGSNVKETNKSCLKKKRKATDEVPSSNPFDFEVKDKTGKKVTFCVRNDVMNGKIVTENIDISDLHFPDQSSNVYDVRSIGKARRANHASGINNNDVRQPPKLQTNSSIYHFQAHNPSKNHHIIKQQRMEPMRVVQHPPSYYLVQQPQMQYDVYVQQQSMMPYNPFSYQKSNWNSNKNSFSKWYSSPHYYEYRRPDRIVYAYSPAYCIPAKTNRSYVRYDH